MSAKTIRSDRIQGFPLAHLHFFNKNIIYFGVLPTKKQWFLYATAPNLWREGRFAPVSPTGKTKGGSMSPLKPESLFAPSAQPDPGRKTEQLLRRQRIRTDSSSAPQLSLIREEGVQLQNRTH
ncbi:MAG: hypothetical protein PHF19_00830 [Synergistales bacterium]|jgi:hypothetical protein|nr:hypothetical protein [Synergistales bacterium]